MISRDQPMYRRRRFIQVVSLGGLAAVAGCLGDDRDDGDDGDDAGDRNAENWQAASLEDTTTGEEFRITEFDDPTLVHTFAANCLTCANQQAEFGSLWERRDDIEIVELSVDPNDTPEDLAAHAESAGLEWHVGVAPEAVTGKLVEEFGEAVTISAQSPVIIVCPDGTTDTVSKIAAPNELKRAIEDTC